MLVAGLMQRGDEKAEPDERRAHYALSKELMAATIIIEVPQRTTRVAP